MRFGIRLVDIIDILIVAYLLYKTYKMLNGTTVIRVFIGILTFVVIWLVVTFVFQMQLLGAIMNQIVNVGVIAIIVLFQDEIRRSLSILGSRKNFFTRMASKFFPTNKNSMVNGEIMQLVLACKSLSKGKVGALIVIQKQMSLESIIATGDIINADINSRLIENIFFKNSPLHDGATIIIGNKIVSAGCILPVTHNLDIPKELGLRHRAALGISEKTDALAIIVSEETGNISVSEAGEFKLKLTPEDLEKILSNKFNTNDKSK
ncbi:MAG TPA: diadenylate cyclase CdaA [Paludibacteraceae bacterium]|nr:diadenylate cyclase CdaA [Paludibacteraceae bacterium]HOU67237.1 diadenylate cyclase CdaA [Paludibacteraceae bacterium]HPH62313.1 diadenylate cyclase CdaA [Paludibacteraceae bacterium]HQF49306.1 diadenylate cyclase CdaA [Paludibacteraceae bacterium]HQJ89015.1 diadenylate cyclase CdaA [Paludibacteraceae bacterium]